MSDSLGTTSNDVERDVLRLMLRTNAELLDGRLDKGPSSEKGVVIAALAAATSLGAVLEDVVTALVRQARSEGHSWADIGYALQVSRQAAFQRFGPHTGEAAEPDSAMLADAPQRATRALSQFLAGEFEALRANFDQRMTEGCSVILLGSVRSSLASSLGAVQRTGAPSVTSRSGYAVVDIPLVFKKGKRKARVAFGSDGRIAGFFVLMENAL
jgi:hypothetical protein